MKKSILLLAFSLILVIHCRGQPAPQINFFSGLNLGKEKFTKFGIGTAVKTNRFEIGFNTSFGGSFSDSSRVEFQNKTALSFSAFLFKKDAFFNPFFGIGFGHASMKSQGTSYFGFYPEKHLGMRVNPKNSKLSFEIQYSFSNLNLNEEKQIQKLKINSHELNIIIIVKPY